MPLVAGTRLGPYEVVGLLGAGGMGEVYRARDTKLGRDVALKILPQRFTADPKREARFDREARILAALNHPHIAAIYGFQEADDSTGLGQRVRALVLELVEGQTLAERLAWGTIPVTEALGIASQVAAALDAAHRKGIVHRDLKPSNIKVTPVGNVKVLDFGVAEIVSDGSASDLSQAPTITDASTREGIVVGTPAYMSPEQARGHAVDGRTDIWAFGCVLYETLTGRAAFARGTNSDTIAAILQHEPEWAALPRSISPVIHRLLRRCLEKDARARVQHFSTVDEMLRQALDHIEPKQPLFAYTRDKLKFAAVVGAVALTATVVALLTFRARDNGLVQQPIGSSPVHRELTFIGNVSEAALSPDGRAFAYTSAGRLLIQEVSGGPAAEIVGVDVAPEGISRPRWSPRGDRVAFFGYDQQGHFLYVVSRHGGRPLNVTRVLPPTYGAWSPDGSRIALAGQDDGGVFTIIDVADGRLISSADLSGFDSAQDINWHPKLDRLALLERDDVKRWVIWIAAPDGREARPVYTDVQAINSICWSPIENRLYFLRTQNEAEELVALDLGDTPSPTPRVLMSGLSAGGSLTISGDGRSLLHVRSTVTANLARFDLTRPDDSMTFITQGTRRFSSPRVSPDGQWIAAVVGVPPRTRIVKVPSAGGELIPLTSGDNLDGPPAWSPDGTSIAFASVRAGTSSVWLMRADGTQLEQLHNSAPSVNLLTTWTPDGRLMWQEVTSMNQMNYRIRDLSSGHDSFLLPPGNRYGFVFLPEFAPSGKELAVFWNRDGGRRGLYVLSWPALVPRLLTNATYWPIGWSADGAAVIAADERSVWLVSTRDGQSRPLTRVSLAGDDLGDVTTNGKYLVSSVTAGTADAWLIEHFDPQARSPTR
jgi:serine/threonine protein kinase/WD40 repeat protein